MTGIVGYGVYIPRYRIRVEEIAKVWNANAETIKRGLGIYEKSVPGIDEDSITLAVEATRNALASTKLNAKKIGAVYIGSESHPYAVKSSSAIVAEAIGACPELMAADLEFACKAGTAAMQICMGLVNSNMIEYGLAIGSDTSQGKPGDALEYSAAAGAAAYVIGKKDVIADINATLSYTTDTPDFWRREGQQFPSHSGRFTGIPAYFKHVTNAAKLLMEKQKTKPADYDYFVAHQPNAKFPVKVAKLLGFGDKIQDSLIVGVIGNTYSASMPLGLANILDKAEKGARILAVSYGSGSGSDAFDISVKKKSKNAKKVQDYIKCKEYIEYGVYAKLMRKLKQ
jgi:hydroxymethylglutaryl-CoA synthase